MISCNARGDGKYDSAEQSAKSTKRRDWHESEYEQVSRHCYVPPTSDNSDSTPPVVCRESIFAAKKLKSPNKDVQSSDQW